MLSRKSSAEAATTPPPPVPQATRLPQLAARRTITVTRVRLSLLSSLFTYLSYVKTNCLNHSLGAAYVNKNYLGGKLGHEQLEKITDSGREAFEKSTGYVFLSLSSQTGSKHIDANFNFTPTERMFRTNFPTKSVPNTLGSINPVSGVLPCRQYDRYNKH